MVVGAAMAAALDFRPGAVSGGHLSKEEMAARRQACTDAALARCAVWGFLPLLRYSTVPAPLFPVCDLTVVEGMPRGPHAALECC